MKRKPSKILFLILLLAVLVAVLLPAKPQEESIDYFDVNQDITNTDTIVVHGKHDDTPRKR